MWQEPRIIEPLRSALQNMGSLDGVVIVSGFHGISESEERVEVVPQVRQERQATTTIILLSRLNGANRKVSVDGERSRQPPVTNPVRGFLEG